MRQFVVLKQSDLPSSVGSHLSRTYSCVDIITTDVVITSITNASNITMVT